MKIRSTLIATAAAAAAVASIAAPSSAAVTFDAATGTGFVGKGDVQLAFAWNNNQLQKNAAGVSFQAASSTEYSVTCEWETVTGGKDSKVIPHAVTTHKTTSVSGTVAYDARVKNQITGFTLTGYGTTVETGGPVPAEGDSCPNGGDGIVTAVTSETTGTQLHAVYGGTAVPLS